MRSKETEMGGNIWKWVKRLFWTLLLVFVLGFLHYTLPQHDIVRVTNTYNRLTTVGTENSWAYSVSDSGTAESAETRDIRFIEAAYSDGSVIVYRNEDTGWIWPPYFKYDSSNLQAEAGNLKSTSEVPKWLVITHYGWRLPILSIYPNAVSVREATSVDERIIPWVSIILLLLFGFLVFMVRRMWLQFVERMVDPALAEVGEAQDRAKGFFGRLFGRKS
jgi:hypothetical protein